MFRESLHRIRNVSGREIVRMTKHPIYFFCLLLAPVISLVFFLSIMWEGLPVDLPIAVVDMDNSSGSREVIRLLDAFEQTQVSFTTASFEEARREMQKGTVYGIFLIPKNFQADILSNQQPKLSYYTNGAYLVPASLLFRDMKYVSILAGASSSLKFGQAHGYTEEQMKAQILPITINTHAIGNPWLNYSLYLNNTLLPGLLQLFILLVTVMSIGSELKEASSREWLRLSNNSLTIGIIGKMLPYTVIFSIIGFLYAVALYGLNSFPLNSGWLPMLSALFLLVISSQAVGIFMIGLLPTFRLGLSFASLFGMIAFSIVGFSFPVHSMDPVLKALTNIFPLRHYFLIYVDQALNGRALIYSWSEYVWLASFLILPFFIGKNLKSALLYFKYIP